MDTKNTKYFFLIIFGIILLLAWFYIPYTDCPFFYHFEKEDMQIVTDYLTIFCAALGLVLGGLFFLGNIRYQEKRRKMEIRLTVMKKIEEKMVFINSLVDEYLESTTLERKRASFELKEASIILQNYLNEIIEKNDVVFSPIIEWYSAIDTGFIVGVLDGNESYSLDAFNEYRDKYLIAYEALTKITISFLHE